MRPCVFYTPVRGTRTTIQYLSVWKTPGRLYLNLFRAVDLQLANSQCRVAVLALDRLHLPLPPLRLFLEPHGLTFSTRHHSSALVKPLVDEWRALEGVVSATDDGRSVETEDVAGYDTGHLEREADAVAWRDEVGASVDVEGNVVAWLGGQEW